MGVFLIAANDVAMGEYQGDTAQDALDNYARDAGYRDYTEVESELGKTDAVVVVEVDIDRLLAAVGEKLSKPIFQDAYGDGVALVDNVSIKTYAELASLGDCDIDDFVKR